MEQYVKVISLRAEFSIVIVIAFGYFMLGSVLSLLFPYPSAPINESHLRFLLVYESVVLLILWRFLSLRGWGFRQLGLTLRISDLVLGIALVAGYYMVYVALWFGFSPFLQGGGQVNDLVAQNLQLSSVLGVSLLNPIFEEVFVCGYVITALKDKRGLFFAVNASIAIRLVYHLYQGAFGVISIIPLGLIFAYWYARTGRLWPVIVAHAVMDFVGLIGFTQGS